MQEIEAIKIGDDFYIIGTQYGKEKKRELVRIKDLTPDIRESPNLTYFVGYDRNNKMIFEIFATNVVVFYKE